VHCLTKGLLWTNMETTMQSPLELILLPFRFPKETFIILVFVVVIGAFLDCLWMCEAGSSGIDHLVSSWADRIEWLVAGIAGAVKWFTL
ncbi:unnamed protein product, partial [marine sediment metagenome]